MVQPRLQKHQQRVPSSFNATRTGNLIMNHGSTDPSSENSTSWRNQVDRNSPTQYIQQQGFNQSQKNLIRKPSNALADSCWARATKELFYSQTHPNHLTAMSIRIFADYGTPKLLYMIQRQRNQGPATSFNMPVVRSFGLQSFKPLRL